MWFKFVYKRILTNVPKNRSIPRAWYVKLENPRKRNKIKLIIVSFFQNLEKWPNCVTSFVLQIKNISKHTVTSIACLYRYFHETLEQCAYLSIC